MKTILETLISKIKNKNFLDIYESKVIKLTPKAFNQEYQAVQDAFNDVKTKHSKRLMTIINSDDFYKNGKRAKAHDALSMLKNLKKSPLTKKEINLLLNTLKERIMNEQTSASKMQTKTIIKLIKALHECKKCLPNLDYSYKNELVNKK